jgi:hypothetical protein
MRFSAKAVSVISMSTLILLSLAPAASAGTEGGRRRGHHVVGACARRG